MKQNWLLKCLKNFAGWSNASASLQRRDILWENRERNRYLKNCSVKFPFCLICVLLYVVSDFLDRIIIIFLHTLNLIERWNLFLVPSFKVQEKKNNPKSCAKNVDVLFSPLTKKKWFSHVGYSKRNREIRKKNFAPDLHHREVRYTFFLSYHREKEIITLFPHPSVTVQNFLHY